MTLGSFTQLDLFGQAGPPQGLSLADKVAYVLDRHPETRDNDHLLAFWCWIYFDGLGNVLADKAEAFRDWFANAGTTDFETWRRRRQEHQQNRTDTGHLRPSEGVAKYRKARDGAGPPR